MGQSDSLPVKIISQDGKDELQVKGYRLHKRRCALAALVILLTLGLVLILIVWRRDIKMFMFYTPCPLQHATKILVKVIILLIRILFKLNYNSMYYNRIVSISFTTRTFWRRDQARLYSQKLDILSTKR